jgi:hypothetical protein
LGISREAFDQALPQLVRSAATDMSTRTNPSLALIGDVTELLIKAYGPRTRP